MAITKRMETKPRRTLTSLVEEWQKADPKRKKIIRKHWSRSVRLMFTEMITNYPDSFTRPTECEQFIKTYASEVRAWWDEPFGSDGVPINFCDGNLTTKVSNERLARSFIYQGTMDASAGTDWRINPGFQPERDELLCVVAYTTAWQLRHAAGEGDGRPAMFDTSEVKPLPSWSSRDFELEGAEEFRKVNIRIRNHEWFHARGEVYRVAPLPKTDGWVVDMIDGKTPYPEGVAAPMGEHGRKMVKEIVQDEFGRLGIRLREQTVGEMAAEEQERLATTWVVSGWHDKQTQSAREFMRPYLAGTENEHLLEGYSDELIHYDLPPEGA